MKIRGSFRYIELTLNNIVKVIQSIIEKYKDRIAVGLKGFINITWIE